MKLTPLKGSERKILYWAAPMDPNERYNEPGKSKMGMDLVPVYEDPLSTGNVVSIDPVLQQNMNLKTVEIKSRDISPIIVTNAEITVDERFDMNLTSRLDGWVEKLYVNFEGEEIKAGQRLCELYSPEIVTAQQELITALDYYEALVEKDDESLLKSGKELVKNSEQKLKLLSISQRDIDAVKESREIMTVLPINSPTNGVVMKKNIVQGQKIKDGDLLLQLTDLGKLWVMADVYENELGLVDIGDDVTTTINSYPSFKYEGKVNFIHPVIDETTRTAKVRIDIENDHKKFKPGMLAKVEIKVEEIDDALLIPEHAVIRSGFKNIAVRALGDGKFQPVEIKIGIFSEGNYQVLNGLEEGDIVVSSAQFLIDSESSLKSAVSQFTKDLPEDSEESHADTADQHTHGLERTGIIDVESIDENGDGKLFECPMDWNVLSDEAGRCPACEMRLKEYSLEEVKDNLKMHGHQHK
jgi:Cu(I)/Ag(I) efflux system membrane fusion protein/cobalt-zinc-cadmium efflux system membrane fusion protein